MSTQAKDKCPLCLETMDLTDKHLKPCKCGYEICLWCWHHIMEMDRKDECGGRCPGCRSIYNKDRILQTSTSNQILKELCADKSNLQQEQMKLQKQKSVTSQSRIVEEPIDPNIVRVIQRKLVYIIGMPSEFASEKVLRQKSFLGQYGKIENIIIDNIGANQQLPDSGRVYVTFSREEEAVLCIESVNGYILNGRPLKATFGVTRYCHIWLSNKVCQKPNCSYVHQKALAEDICTKDDVGVFCARLQHLLGMNMTGPQRSGSTLPSPGGCNSKISMCTGNSKDKICINEGVVSRDGSKNPGTAAAIIRDSIHPSGKPPSIVNAALHQLNNHDSILSQQKKVSSKSQELPQLGPKSRLDEQLASTDDKSQESAHLGDEVSDSKQMTSAVNGTVETSWRKLHYATAVSQGSSGPSRRFTVLTRELTSTDTRSKATGQEGSWISKKLALQKENDRVTFPRSQNLKIVSQRPEEPPHRLTSQLSSTVVKSHAAAEEKSALHITIRDTPVQRKHMQFPVSTASSSATALQSVSSTVLSNLSTSDAVTQTSVGTYKLPHRKLASESKPQILCQQKAPVSDKGVGSVSECRSIHSNQVVCSDDKHQTSAQGGDHSSCTGETAQSGDQTSSEQAGSILLSRPVSVLSSTDILAKDNNERKRLVCPPGFKVLHKSSDSGSSVPMSSSTCSALCSTSDAPLQAITDQPDIISWVSECLEDGGDTRQSNSVSIPSTLSSTDSIWRPTQLPGSSLGASNHCVLPPYPGGMLQCMGGNQNPMICCCTFPSVSSIPNQKPEYWNGGASSYMAPGGYNTFYQNTASGMRTGMVGTLLQQSSPPGLYNDWTNGSADPGLNTAQVGHPYSMYSLF
uniref:Uncharacterized protein n=1 Tax=Avena sativa TaxID=4498 RepID=A0ACD5VCH0_AVESA